jgi:hypothetical protein
MGWIRIWGVDLGLIETIEALHRHLLPLFHAYVILKTSHTIHPVHSNITFRIDAHNVRMVKAVEKSYTAIITPCLYSNMHGTHTFIPS